MNSYTLALRYARSIFALSKEAGSVNIYYEQLLEIKKILESSKDLENVLSNLKVTSAQKINLITKIFENQKLEKDIFNFLKLLILKSRFIIFNEIFKVFEEIYHTYNRKVVVQITTAKKLEENQKQQLQDKLESSLDCKINLKETINTDLLGGLVVQVNSLLIDGSVRNFLTNIRNSIR